MFKAKGVLRWKDFIFRLARTEGALRGFNFFFLFGVLKSLAYVKSTYYDPSFVEPKKVEEQKTLESIFPHLSTLSSLSPRLKSQRSPIQKQSRRSFQTPQKPRRSPRFPGRVTSTQFIYIYLRSKTYEQLADFLSYDQAMDVNMDQQKGLDSWMSVQDRRMLKYY